MKTITISEPVWQAIANLGKFGETEDDVLRRVFKLSVDSIPNEEVQRQTATTHFKSSPRRSFATDRMSSYISGTQLRISFASGPSDAWALPPKNDKAALREVREKATRFAISNGATVGQVNAVRKTLTDAGYHLTK